MDQQKTGYQLVKLVFRISWLVNQLMTTLDQLETSYLVQLPTKAGFSNRIIILSISNTCMKVSFLAKLN